MICRRELMMAFTACAVGGPGLAQPQQPTKLARVAMLLGGSPQTIGYLIAAVKDRLHELNYVEGKNVAFDVRWAMGALDRLPALADELVALGPDVIWTIGAPGAVAARRATATIPIVFAGLSDPVGLGLAKTLSRPGGNVTGVASLGADASPKLLELLRAVLPKLARVAVLWTSSNTPTTLAKLVEAARSLKIALVAIHAETAADFDAAFAHMVNERVEALVVPSGAPAFLHRGKVIELVNQHSLPSVFQQREFVQAGGLMSYGQNLVASMRQSAAYVDKILRGARPGELPIEQATTLELVVNATAAKALGLTIPQSLLLRADEVIE